MTDAIVAEDVTQSFWELCQSAALIMKKFFPSDFPKLIFLSKQESITLNSDNLSKDPTIKLIMRHSSNNAIVIISVLIRLIITVKLRQEKQVEINRNPLYLCIFHFYYHYFYTQNKN